MRLILAGLLGVGDGQDFDAGILDALTPEMVFRIDLIAGAILDFGRTDETVRAIRAAVMKPVPKP